ncbi:methionine biosynthesis protein MetW [Magnetospira thiophila]
MSGLKPTDIRVDLQLIADMIPAGSRVLDIGCEDGTLLDYLTQFKQVDGRGIELSNEGVRASVAAGLSVIQGDADTDLEAYPDKAFDYVILSQTLQATRRPDHVLSHLVRIGTHAIVSVPNFGHWRIRWTLFAEGRMPVSENLPYEWYDTPNIHLCTLKDIIRLCNKLGITIERSISVNASGVPQRIGSSLAAANLFGEQGVFLLRKL